eukprot:c8281_g1_i1.p1 GENE.c8281_g1_i1~~c8281_g1_i1.p1  ORF type:complete len:150 (+),score=21.90 c8281_g1_i1:632-1081(+)
MDSIVNQISDDGARHIATAIGSGKCLLTHLCLRYNQISNHGAHHIATVIESGQCSLKDLDLNSNVMSGAVSAVISQAVKHHRSLNVVVIEYGTSKRRNDELKALLGLSAHCRLSEAVKVIVSLIIDRTSSVKRTYQFPFTRLAPQNRLN